MPTSTPQPHAVDIQTPTAFNFFIPIHQAISVLQQQLQPAIDKQQLHRAMKHTQGEIICSVGFILGDMQMMFMRGDYLPAHYANRIKDILFEYQRDERKKEALRIAKEFEKHDATVEAVLYESERT